jgi:hypothetical protein
VIPIRRSSGVNTGSEVKKSGGHPAVTLAAGSIVSVVGGNLAGRSQHVAAKFEHAVRTFRSKGASDLARESTKHFKTFSRQASALRTGAATVGAALIGSGVNEALKKNETFRNNDTLRFLAAGGSASAAFFGTRLGYYAHLNRQSTILKTLKAAGKSAAFRMFIKP